MHALFVTQMIKQSVLSLNSTTTPRLTEQLIWLAMLTANVAS